MITGTSVERKMRTIHRLCYLFLIFLTGCVTGWVYEEIFYWITEGILLGRIPSPGSVYTVKDTV